MLVLCRCWVSVSVLTRTIASRWALESIADMVDRGFVASWFAVETAETTVSFAALLASTSID